MGEVIWRASKTGLLAGVAIAVAMVIYAVILKLIGQQAGASTIGYYIVFPVVLFATLFLARNTLKNRLLSLGLVWVGVIATVSGAALYNVWVVVNTRFLIGGPILQLVSTYETYLARAEAGENVSSELAVIESFMASPELFAVNVFARLVILFVPVAIVFALIVRFVFKRSD